MANSEEAFEDEIIEIFAEEVAEVMDLIDVNLQCWENDLVVDKPLKELRRAFHTLKGSGRMVQADAISELAWSVEDMLNKIVDGVVSSSPAAVALVADVQTVIPALLSTFVNRQAQAVSGVNINTFIDRAQAIIASNDFNEPKPSNVSNITHKDVSYKAVSDDSTELALLTSELNSVQFEEFRSEQAGLTGAVAAIQLDLTGVGIKIETLESRIQDLSEAATVDSNVDEQIKKVSDDLQDMQYFIKSSTEQLQADLKLDQGRLNTQVHSLQHELAKNNKEFEQAIIALKKRFILWAVSGSAAALALAVLFSMFF